MRASLLGIELRGATARLTVVDRSGVVLAHTDELLDGDVGEWWRVHPEERYRGVLALLDKGLREGVLQGGQVAAVGLSCDPGLALLDRDLKAIPPRDIPWDELLGDEPRTAAVAMRNLGSGEGRWTRQIGGVLGVLDYLRFRMTGAIATHQDFAHSTGLTAAAHPRNWDLDKLEATGIAADAFPPVFAANCKVGVISEEIVQRSGMGHGIWVNAGCTPLAGDLFLAAEPKLGNRVVRIECLGETQRAELWEGTAPPESPPEDSAEVSSAELRWAPGLTEEGAWYHRIGTQPLEASTLSSTGALESLPAEWWQSAATLDFREVSLIQESSPFAPKGLKVAHGAGAPSAAAAIGAGMALGWWRDPRGLWRKGRQAVDYATWKQARAGEPS